MKKGISASKGYAIGKVLVKEQKDVTITQKDRVDIREEKKRLKDAIETSRIQLSELRDKTILEIGAQEAEVFESHLLMLDDPEFTGVAETYIETASTSAEVAIKSVIEMCISIFSGIEDEYMKERTADIEDVGSRILKNLSGIKPMDMSGFEKDTVIVAHDLTPSDTAQLDKNKVVAFLTDIGGSTAHSAIMARTLGIPAIVGLEDITLYVKTGDTVIVDGVDGIVILNPDEETIKFYEAKKAKLEQEKINLKKLKDSDTVTRAGKKIIVAGNIGSPEDVKEVIENGGEGIGLFRTEFLYMNKDQLPSEEEQFLAYKKVAKKFGDKAVIVRTLDIGGDKKLNYLALPEEINPFLGYRAIRLCLDKQEVFKTQLRAILRASAFGNVQIMFPMIGSIDEFLKAKSILKSCMDELKSEEKNFNESIQTGIMVEVPSAAIMADEFAKLVDFFSIGSNDLIQYTLAADRTNENVSYLYDPMHPAVLRLIKMTIEAAHREGKWCGMCGEMAAYEKAVPLLLEYGLDEFSMSASSILPIKQIIINN